MTQISFPTNTYSLQSYSFSQKGSDSFCKRLIQKIKEIWKKICEYFCCKCKKVIKPIDQNTTSIASSSNPSRSTHKKPEQSTTSSSITKPDFPSSQPKKEEKKEVKNQTRPSATQTVHAPVTSSSTDISRVSQEERKENKETKSPSESKKKEPELTEVTLSSSVARPERTHSVTDGKATTPSAKPFTMQTNTKQLMLSFLDLRDIAAFSATSKENNKEADHPVVWKNLIRRYHPDSTFSEEDTLESLRKQFRDLSIKRIESIAVEGMQPIHVPFYKNVTTFRRLRELIAEKAQRPLEQVILLRKHRALWLEVDDNELCSSVLADFLNADGTAQVLYPETRLRCIWRK